LKIIVVPREEDKTMNIEGKVWKYGSDVDTDVIIPARYLNTSDPAELAKHCLEDLDEKFVDKMTAGDLIVAEDNFGCGSSREHAPLAIKAAGVSCVIANSFARIFYRNAINIGLPIMESPGAVAGIEEGDQVEVDVDSGTIINLTQDEEYQAEAFPEFMQELIGTGGLIEYVNQNI
jgi:3-isopropylmalate/(R)-2-methylmalate dehydratase small subunit